MASTSGLWVCHHCGSEIGYMESDMVRGKAFSHSPGIVLQTLLIYCKNNEDCTAAAYANRKIDMVNPKDIQ